MINYSKAQSAYSQPQSSIKSPRSLEYELFLNVTRRLKEVQDQSETQYASFIEALHRNRCLWTFVASAVAENRNLFPSDLRARLFYLAEFTELHSRAVINKGKSILPLIEINSSIISALRQTEN